MAGLGRLSAHVVPYTLLKMAVFMFNDFYHVQHDRTHLTYDRIIEEVYSSEPFTGADNAVYEKEDIIC